MADLSKARARFVLMAVTSLDGFMARAVGEPPSAWQSPEEMEMFANAVAAADWCVMGRDTHEAAPRTDRRRVIFSRAGGAGDWRAPNQLWVDPATTTPDGLALLVGGVRPMREALILGGRGVHAWFLEHGRIDEVRLSVEPVMFGEGVPVFEGDGAQDPVEIFRQRGFQARGETRLNRAGLRLVILTQTS